MTARSHTRTRRKQLARARAGRTDTPNRGGGRKKGVGEVPVPYREIVESCALSLPTPFHPQEDQ